MNNLLTPIPLKFVQSKSSLFWRDCLWAYKRHQLTWRDLVQVASQRVNDGSENEQEIELASVGKVNIWKISELAQSLSENEYSEELSKQKWLFLSLAWLYENQENFPEPLAIVEEIYADFDYPSSIESFIRYLPPSDGYISKQFSQEQNRLRLMTKWHEFLLKNSVMFKVQKHVKDKINNGVFP